MEPNDRQDQAQKEKPSQAAAAEEGDAAEAPPSAELLEAEALKAKFLNGVSWFYWIGGLSLVNIAMGFLERKFIFGLGISELLESFALQGESVSIPLMAASALVSLGFLGLGWQARKGRAAFIVGGLVFYALDAALLAWAEDIISVAFHAYAGYCIFRGWQALRTIRAGVSAAA